SLGVITHLCFGSEDGEIDRFLETASVLNDEDRPGSIFQKTLTESLKSGLSYADARDCAIKSALSDSLPDDFLSTPNNILGIEYCHALKRLGSSIVPLTIKREGQAYDDTSDSFIKNFDTYAFPSSSALRKHLKEIKVPHMETEFFSDMIYYSLLELFKSGDDIAYPKDMSKALANRIKNNIEKFTDPDGFIDEIKTKAFTTSRIKRCLIQSLLGIYDTDNDIRYLRLLGFRSKASPLIKEIKKSTAPDSDNGNLHILTRLADDLPKLDESAKKMYDSQDLFAADLYRNVFEKKCGVRYPNEYQQTPVII
ncbi:MAG: nucleotidyltransferase family protein, partial [Eubacterium sp.]|nr:nucleotidyltransferase family protein [Eubacterium sp.]